MFMFKVPRTGPPVLQNAVETRPKATAAWLECLPFASPPAAAQQLVGALYALNRLALPEDERHALLPVYRPVVERVAASLETQLAGAGVPPLAQQQQIGAQLRELRLEHSIAYKHVLKGLLAHAAGRGSLRRRTAEVVGRLAAALRDVLVASYQTYTPPPPTLWLELHQLYLLARDAGLADTAIDDAPSASVAYRQALLLALADPPHMSQPELAHTRLFLDSLAALAVLGPPPAPLPATGFAIATDQDRGASPLAASLQAPDLWLDTEALCRHLHKLAQRLHAGEEPSRLGLAPAMSRSFGKALSRHLLKLWHTGLHRSFNRYPSTGGTMQLIAGVSAIHHLLDQAPAPEPEPATEGADSLDIHDVAPLAIAPLNIQASQWTVSNDSAAGLALSGSPDAPLNLKVGDALALRTDAESAWSLGVIRWIRMHDARQVDLGVQRLSPQMQPVWVRPLRGQRKTSPEPALLVPGNAALKQADRLLLPHHVYQSGMDAVVWQAPRQYTLTFGRRHEHTPSFDLIDFTLF